MGKTTYLVIAKMAGNFAMVGQTKDPTETVEQVVRRASEKPSTALAEEELEASPLRAPICAVHQLPMLLMHGRRGPFWSCHQKKDDGSWCSYKPGL
jgi:hypothetical protein